jgi:hypothetical protein
MDVYQKLDYQNSDWKLLAIEIDTCRASWSVLLIITP